MKFPEWNSERVFGWVNYRSLSYFCLAFFVVWVLFMILMIEHAYLLLAAFTGISIIWHIITLLPLIQIIIKLKREARKIEREMSFGSWEQAVFGFYVISNLGIMAFLSVMASDVF